MGTKHQDSHVATPGFPLLVVNNASKKSGVTAIDFGFLAQWLSDQQLVLVWRSLNRYKERYSTASQTYALRSVLAVWCRIGTNQKWTPPSKSDEPGLFLQRLSELRVAFYKDGSSRGCMLSTSTFGWSCFRQYLEDLIAEGAICRVDLDSRAIAKPPMHLVQLDRGQAAADKTRAHSALSPRTLNVANDSYNTDLLEAISISAVDEVYLTEYEARLETTLATFHACALADFEEMEEKHAHGKRLLAVASDETSEVLSSEDQFLKKCLEVVVHEMGGIPQLGTPARPNWPDIQKFGKNNLLPYLGILTSEMAAACIVLILLEHPKLNSSSITRARVTDERGRQILLLDATEGSEEQTRIVLDKPRANVQKSAVLSSLALRVVSRVLDWTSLPRQRLLEAGKTADTKKLWVGMSMLTYEILQFSDRTLYNAFKGAAGNRDWGEERSATRRIPFLERHSRLASWSHATYKGLRVSSGVLVYLKSSGDLVATAQAFGHKGIRTTVKHYVPEPLRLAIYERQIRRHQNRLIVEAASSEAQMLGMTDFSTVEKLHEFLDSILDRNLFGIVEDPPGCDTLQSKSDEAASKGSQLRKLVLCSDSRALAVGILYRDYLRDATPGQLDRPDAGTGVAPRFWRDFIDCLQGPLPLSMSEISDITREAERLVPSLAKTIRFPVLTE